MLSMASVNSAGGAASYFAKDNYYSNEESAESSQWYGAGAEMLGLVASEGGELEAAEPGDASGSATETEAGQEPVPEEGTVADAILEEDPAAELQEDPGDAPLADPATAVGDELETDTGDHTIQGDGAANGPDASDTAADQGVVQDAAEGGPALAEEASAPGVGSDAPGTVRGDETADRPSIALDIGDDPDPDALPAFAIVPPEAAPGATGAEKANLPLSNHSGRVDPATFENILNGILPDGTQVGDPDNRKLGMDLTFSAPKSVSIVGLIGGDKRVSGATLDAVKATMRFAEQHLAEGRSHQNGRDVPVKTGNLVYSLFAHDTSRALDPQDHIHVIVANMTRMPDGQWKALHNGQLWKNNTVLGSVFNAALRANLEKLGYTVELTGKHGSFEIVGVPKDVREAFSQRREQILSKATELGVSSHSGLDSITTNTRDPKINSPDHTSLLGQWQARIAELGFDPQSVIDQAKSRVAGPANWLQQGAQLATGVRTGIERAVDFMRFDNDPLLSNGTAKLGITVEARTELAVASAIRHLDQREAAFGVHQLTKAALDQGQSGVTPAGIAARVSRLLRGGELVPGVSNQADQTVTMVATRTAIQTEQKILTEIERGKGVVEPLTSPTYAATVVRAAAGTRDLNAGQLAAAVSIISSDDRIIAIQGIAGAGKSTMLGVAARVAETYGQKVLGLAFQNKMVGDLAEGAGIEAQTLASFLMPYERMIAENDRSGLNAARKEMRGSMVIVDEASMVSNRQMASLTHIANFLELDKLVLVGDRQQLLSIDAGKSFALAQAGGAATARMNENLRQRTDEMRTVAALSNRGRAGEALGVLGTKVISTPNRIAEAAAQWLALPSAERDRTMVLTSGREARGNLNVAIQKGLIAEGSLTGEGTRLTAIEHVDRTREDLRHVRNYEPGLGLSLWGNEKSLGLTRGEYKIVRLIKGGRVQLERDGKKTIIDPKRLSPSRQEDRMTMIATKEITLHEGDKIRWTGNDKGRSLHNSALGRVFAVGKDWIAVEIADKNIVKLSQGDPMLRRLGLAYTLNMHMAQGVTTDKAMIVMGSEERFLANQRLFNVGVTRARDGVTVITDDQGKLARQLNSTPGDNASALEMTGKIVIDWAPRSGPGAPLDLGPIPKDALEGLRRDPLSPSPTPASPSAPAANDPSNAPPLDLPEKSKGLSL